MHILFVLDYFAPYIGGIETLFDDVTDFCVQKWYIVTVLTSRHDPRLKKIEKKKGVTIYRVGQSRITILWHALLWGLRNRHILTSIDHIHTSTFTSSIPAWILAKWYKKTCTITIHEIYDRLRYHIKGNKAIFSIRFEWLVLKFKRDHIIAVSHYTKHMIQDIHHLPESSVSVIYNQIDTKFWNPETVSHEDIEKNKKTHHLTEWKTLLFIGRLGYEKGLPYLIEAMNTIITTHPHTKLIIIGPKTPHLYPEHIRQQITTTKNQIVDNNLTNHILWIDHVPDDEALRLWMASVDIGVVPSMSEGFCYTAVQMQAMGMNLVVSDVWALPEVIEKQHNFVPYGKIQALADAISTLLLSKQQKDRPSSIIHHPSSIDYSDYLKVFEHMKG